MAGITLTQAQAQLDAWIAASIAVANNQEYDITAANGSRRKLIRADAMAINEQIKFWNAQVLRLSSTRGRTRYLVPE